MKPTLAAIAALLWLAAATLSAPVPVTLICDPNPPEDAILAYVFHQDGRPVAEMPVPQVTLQLEPGRYAFTATARNMWGESGPSNIVITPGAPSSPKALRIEVAVHADGTAELKVSGTPWQTVRLEASPDLKRWETIAELANVMGSFAIVDSGAIGQRKMFWRGREVAM